jgi:ankyrin repeat protein
VFDKSSTTRYQTKVYNIHQSMQPWSETGQKLVEILPRIRTKVQLTGLAIAIVGFLLIRVASPTALGSQIALGSIGILLIVFAQVFHFLPDFPQSSRLILILALFFGFLIFAGVMLWMTFYFLGDAKKNLAIVALHDKAIELSTSSFLDRVKRGNPRTVELFLSAGYSPDLVIPGEESPLALAARQSDPDVLNALLAAHAYVNIESEGITPLTAAIEADRLENVRILLHSGADPNRAPGKCVSPLGLATRDIAILRMLLDSGAKLDSESSCQPILVEAARLYSTEVVALLVKRGAHVNEANVSGVTPLMAASGGNVPHRDAKVETINVLLASGADPNLRDREGTTALMNAVSAGSFEAVQLLIQAKADPNICDEAGFGPLMLATQMKDRSEILKALLKAHADPNARTSELGLTPLHNSLRGTSPFCEKSLILLESGANPRIADKNGRLPLSDLPTVGAEEACDQVRRLSNSKLSQPIPPH